MSSSENNKTWRFLSNHTQVLLCLIRDPTRDSVTSRRVSESPTCRPTHRRRPVESGYVESERIGRRNRYRVNTEVAMRHPAQDGHEIGELLQLLQPTDD